MSICYWLFGECPLIDCTKRNRVRLLPVAFKQDVRVLDDGGVGDFFAT
jgi:hypothetical protein